MFFFQSRLIFNRLLRYPGVTRVTKNFIYSSYLKIIVQSIIYFFYIESARFKLCLKGISESLKI